MTQGKQGGQRTVKIRTTMRPNETVEVSVQEARTLADQGLVFEPSKAAQSAINEENK